MPQTRTPVPADLVTYQEAARQLGITLDSVRTAAARGRIRPIKLPGHHYKYLRQRDVDEYQQKRRVDYPDQEAAQPAAAASVPVALTPAAPMSPEEMRAYAQALAAPMENLARAAVHEATPGLIALVLGGLQIQRGQQPTLDPKALAV